MTDELPLRNAQDVLAAVPYLLGFHPAKSVVVLGLRGPELVFQLRGDLPEEHETRQYAHYYSDLVARQHVNAAMLVGYGTPEAVTPILSATRQALAKRRIQIRDVIQVAGGRYRSYLCPGPDCCPPEGKPYDIRSHPIAAAATVSGMVALPSRAHLERRIAPQGGPGRGAMKKATIRAAHRLTDLLGTDLTKGAVAVRKAGAVAVDRALARIRGGDRLDDDEVAWLAVLLGHMPVRDHAWQRIGGDLGLHVMLWTDVVRRIDPALAAPAATLLAFASWRAGEGAMASIALDRALKAEPGYRMARLLSHALRNGLSPLEWDAAMRDASWDQAMIRAHRHTSSRPIRRTERRPVRT